jgi:hypothetical protein
VRVQKTLQYINESSLHAGYRKQEPVAVNRRLHFSTLRDGFFCGLFRSRKQSQTGFKVMITSSTHSKPTMALLTTHQMIWRAFVAVVLLLIGVSVALADDRERAQAIHDRLAGVPPTDAVLDTMEGMVAANNFSGAADVAMANQHFAEVTLKNFAAPWTNRDQSVFVPLNDYITLVIGMIINDEPFNEVLSIDRLYVENGQPLPTATSNAHYEALESRMQALDFNLMTELVPTTQSGAYPLPAPATAGAMTTRAASEAFFIAGTNRAMFRFTLMNHMCMDLEQVHDVSIIPDRIRQDVSRSPGGDSRVFMNNCIGCHSGMDPMA